MKDIRQSSSFHSYLSSIGWKIDSNDKAYFSIRSLPLLGNVVKLQRPLEITPEILTYIKNTYRPFLTVVEPIDETTKSLLQEHGFKLSNSPYLPSQTIEINLTFPQNRLLTQMKKDARRAILKMSLHDIKDTQDITYFREIWKTSVPRSRYVPSLSDLLSLKAAFKNKSIFLLSNKYKSGAVFLVSDKKAYYWFAFTSPPGRKAQIQYRIVWQGIIWAKRKKAKVMDMEGIYDDRFPLKSWLGFTHFKKSFGGKVRIYPGAFTKRAFPLHIIRTLLK